MRYLKLRWEAASSNKYISLLIQIMLYPSDKKVKASGNQFSGCFLLYKKLSVPVVCLTMVIVLLSSYNLHAQDTSKALPNGTDGLTFTPRSADSTFINQKKDLPPNEF